MPLDSKGLNQLPLIKALSLPLSAGQMVQQALAFFSGPTEAHFFCWQFNTVNGAMWEILRTVDSHHLMWMVNQACCLAASAQNNSPLGSPTPSFSPPLSVSWKESKSSVPPSPASPTCCILLMDKRGTNIPTTTTFPTLFGLIIKAWKLNGNNISQLMLQNNNLYRLRLSLEYIGYGTGCRMHFLQGFW